MPRITRLADMQIFLFAYPLSWYNVIRKLQKIQTLQEPVVPQNPNRKIERKEGSKMSIMKVIEILAESEVSWEDAALKAVTEAGETIDQIHHVYIEHFQGIVENNKIVKYRVNAKISFVVKGH